MVYICKKPKGSCRTCPHFRYDNERDDLSCFAAQDEKERVLGKQTNTLYRNLNVTLRDNDITINGNLHTFDNSKMSARARILWAIARELDFNPEYLFEPDDEDFVF